MCVSPVPSRFAPSWPPARGGAGDRGRAGFSLIELLVAMAIVGLITSMVLLVRAPSTQTRVREDTQRLGLRVARAIAWSREMGREVVVVPTRYGFLIGQRPAAGVPTMLDVNALGPGMNDNGRVGMEVTTGATTAIALASGGSATEVVCRPNGTCDAAGDGVVLTITAGASVGRVFVNSRGRVRVVRPTR